MGTRKTNAADAAPAEVPENQRAGPMEYEFIRMPNLRQQRADARAAVADGPEESTVVPEPSGEADDTPTGE